MCVCVYVGGGRGGDSVVCTFLNWDAENVFHDTCIINAEPFVLHHCFLLKSSSSHPSGAGALQDFTSDPLHRCAMPA